MKRRLSIFSALLLLFISSTALHSQQPSKQRDPNIPLAPGEVPDAKPAQAKQPKYDYYAEITDNPKLPRVLLMGDSVSISYSPYVRQELKDVANIHRVPANCGATKTALSDYGLSRWLKAGEKWDVIVFNHGLHDASFSSQINKIKTRTATTRVQHGAASRMSRLKNTKRIFTPSSAS